MLFFQTDLVPRPFRHVYVQHGYFLTDEFATNPTNFLLSAIDYCEEYMETYFSLYLLSSGYDTVAEYSDYLEANPDNMDALAVVLTAMLNQVHVCVHHAGGLWHTHVKTRPSVFSTSG